MSEIQIGPSEADGLYGLPRHAFVPARDALARRLRTAGEQEAAQEVRRLTKPTLAAWAVNQVARRAPDEMSAFLAAGERLREAQERLLSGGDPADLRSAALAERAAVARLAERASQLLEDEAGAATESTLQAVRDTLHAATLDAEVRELARLGRLSREARPAGLGPFDLVAAPAPVRRPRPAPAPRREEPADLERRRREERRREAEATLKAARSDERARERALGRAEEDAGRAGQARDAAHRTLEGARRAAEAADDAARRAEERLAEARREHAAAREAARAADAALADLAD